MPKIKLKLSTIINRLILGKLVGNIPYSIIRDIKEVIEQDKYKNRIKIVKKIDHAYVEKYDFPKSYPMRFPRDKAYESKFIYEVSNATLSTRTRCCLARR